MSSTTISILLIGALAFGGILAWMNRCSWFSICDVTDPAQLIANIVKAAQGSLSSVSTEHEVGDAITAATNAQGHPFQITKQNLAPYDKSVQLAAAPSLTYVPNKGLVPAKQNVSSSVNTTIHQGTTTSVDATCQAGSHDDGNGGCVLNSSYGRAMMAQMTVTGGRLSYF